MQVGKQEKRCNGKIIFSKALYHYQTSLSGVSPRNIPSSLQHCCLKICIHTAHLTFSLEQISCTSSNAPNSTFHPKVYETSSLVLLLFSCRAPFSAGHSAPSISLNIKHSWYFSLIAADFAILPPLESGTEKRKKILLLHATFAEQIPAYPPVDVPAVLSM